MKKIYSVLFALLCVVSTQAKTIHVSPNGSNSNKGTSDAPYRTISKAAYVALGGDSIIIHEGTYREREIKTIEINTSMLGISLISEQEFGNIDGSDFIFNTDLLNSPRNIESPTAGPFESKPQGIIWKTL